MARIGLTLCINIHKMWLRNLFAVSRDLSCSTAMLISLAVEGELRYASDRCLIFKD
jgi:hypothetical protein